MFKSIVLATTLVVSARAGATTVKDLTLYPSKVEPGRPQIDCDIIIASDDALFCDPVVTMGVLGVEWFVHPWELGARKAKEFLFTGERMPAAAARWRRSVSARSAGAIRCSSATMPTASSPSIWRRVVSPSAWKIVSRLCESCSTMWFNIGESDFIVNHMVE